MINKTVPVLVAGHSSADHNVTLTIASMACAVSLGCIMALAVFGNILVLVAVCRTKSLRTTAAILVVNLALVDLSITVAVVPFVTVTAVTEEWILPWAACQVTGFVNAFLTAAQIMALFHISVNRYIAVAYPHSYETRCNKRVTLLTVLLGWLYSLTWSLLPLFGWGQLGFIYGTLFCNILWSEQLSYAITVQVTCYFVPTIFATVLYLGVYKHVRKQRKRVFEKTLSYELEPRRKKPRTESLHGGVSAKTNTSLSCDKICISTDNISASGFEDLRIATRTTSRGSRSRVKEARVTKTVLAVAMAFVVCWIPRGVANLWALSVGRVAVPRALEYSSTVFVFLNAAVNPVLYGALHQEFKRAFKRILCCDPKVNRTRAATNTSGSVFQR